MERSKSNRAQENRRNHDGVIETDSVKKKRKLNLAKYIT